MQEDEYVLAPALEMALDERNLSVATAENRPSLSESALENDGQSDEVQILRIRTRELIPTESIQ